MPILSALALCVAVDGDSLHCGDERVRLLGIDAPEFYWPLTRRCVPGDPKAAKDTLARSIRGHRLTIERVGRDSYQSPCNQPLHQCGETLITDSLISQSLDYPGDDGSKMRMDFRLDRISGELTNTYTRNGELDGVATPTCERSETPPVPKI